MKTNIPASRINSEKRRLFRRSSGARLASSGRSGEGMGSEDSGSEDSGCEEMCWEGMDLITAALGIVPRNRTRDFLPPRN
jgi:hypothetical protein